MAKLDPKAAGLAVGIPWSLGVLAVGLASTKGYGKKFVDVLGSVYPGYDSTPGGACVGSVWAFFDGLGGGIIYALLYNAFSND